MPKSPTKKTIKRLFVVSSNQCAYPNCTMPIAKGETIIGEICHIKGKKPGAARYDANQTDEERHSFDNLILLCGTHHTVVDDAPDAFTVEYLQKMKREHEARQTASVEPSDALVHGLLATLIEDIHRAVIVETPVLSQIEKASHYVALRSFMKDSKWYDARDIMKGIEDYKDVPDLVEQIRTECDRLDLLADAAADAFANGDLISFVNCVQEMKDNATSELLDRCQHAWQLIPILAPTVLYHDIDAVKSGIVSLSLTYDSHLALIGFDDAIVRIFDLDNHTETRTFRSLADVLVAMPDGRSVLTTRDESVHWWDFIKDGVNIDVFTPQYTHSRGSVTSLAVISNGKRFIVGHEDGIIRVWNTKPQDIPCGLSGHKKRINALVLLSDERHILSASDDGTARLWDLSSCPEALTSAQRAVSIRNPVLTLHGMQPGVNAIAVTSDRRWAITAAKNATLKLWDLDSGAVVHQFSGYRTPVNAIALAPNDSYAVTGDEAGAITIWELVTGIARRVLRHPHDNSRFSLRGEREVSALAFTHDGQRLISGSADGTVCLWQLPAGLFTSKMLLAT